MFGKTTLAALAVAGMTVPALAQDASTTTTTDTTMGSEIGHGDARPMGRAHGWDKNHDKSKGRMGWSFERLDTNGDGSISMEEFEAAKPGRHGGWSDDGEDASSGDMTDGTFDDGVDDGATSDTDAAIDTDTSLDTDASLDADASLGEDAELDTDASADVDADAETDSTETMPATN